MRKCFCERCLTVFTFEDENEIVCCPECDRDQYPLAIDTDKRMQQLYDERISLEKKAESLALTPGDKIKLRNLNKEKSDLQTLIRMREREIANLGFFHGKTKSAMRDQIVNAKAKIRDLDEDISVFTKKNSIYQAALDRCEDITDEITDHIGEINAEWVRTDGVYYCNEGAYSRRYIKFNKNGTINCAYSITRPMEFMEEVKNGTAFGINYEAYQGSYFYFDQKSDGEYGDYTLEFEIRLLNGGKNLRLNVTTDDVEDFPRSQQVENQYFEFLSFDTDFSKLDSDYSEYYTRKLMADAEYERRSKETEKKIAEQKSLRNKQNSAILDEINSLCESNRCLAMYSSPGVTVEQDTVIRNAARTNGGLVKLYKKEYVSQAWAGTRFEPLLKKMEGPTVFIFAPNEEAFKNIYQQLCQNRLDIITGYYVDAQAAPLPQVEIDTSAPQFNEDADCTLILTKCGRDKITVIKAVKDNFGLGLKEAKELVERTPAVLKDCIKHEEAVKIAHIFESIGAETEIKNC